LGKNKKQVEVKTENEKNISTTKLLYLVIFLLFAGMILLYSSDTFKSLPKGGAVSHNHSTDPHAGADLSKLNEIKSLEETMAANPKDHQTLLKLGHLYNDSGYKEKAIETYTKYLAVHPKEADVIVDMSVCYFDLSNNEKALELLKEAISIEPKHQIAHFNMGIVYFSSGNTELAKKWWQDAVNIDPNSEVGKRAEELSKSH
jgi:tetratricopeptide (TPR) repeat protein